MGGAIGGVINGFTSSEQFQNLQQNGKFASNADTYTLTAVVNNAGASAPDVADGSAQLASLANKSGLSWDDLAVTNKQGWSFFQTDVSQSSLGSDGVTTQDASFSLIQYNNTVGSNSGSMQIGYVDMSTGARTTSLTVSLVNDSQEVIANGVKYDGNVGYGYQQTNWVNGRGAGKSSVNIGLYKNFSESSD